MSIPSQYDQKHMLFDNFGVFDTLNKYFTYIVHPEKIPKYPIFRTGIISTFEYTWPLEHMIFKEGNITFVCENM